jgi:radical SAM superfamily enzyme
MLNGRIGHRPRIAGGGCLFCKASSVGAEQRDFEKAAL